MNPAEFRFLARAEEDFWWFRGMRRILFALLEPAIRGRSIENVLEAGCGTGHFAHLLARRYGWRVFAVDLAWEGLAYGRQKGIASLAQADIARLPFPPGCFDAAFSLDVLVHFPEGGERSALAELARVLKPGGLLVLRVAALKILRSRHSQFTCERQRFTAGRLLAALESCGLRPFRWTYANTLLMPVALVKFRLWEPLLRKRPASGLVPLPDWLNELLTRVLYTEAELLAAGVRFPLGQSLIVLGEKAA
ncbi:MAG: class I SAM-dependent methyltransferase [Bryobacteraceae bacterium]|nr:class I SAM-dependent methyltransferase [Bryobacteraceae bacterium]